MLPDVTSFLAFYRAELLKTLSSEDLHTLVGQFQAQGYTLTDGYAWPFDHPENIINESTKVDRAIQAICRFKKPLATGLKFWKFPFEFDFSFLADRKSGTRWMVSVEDKTLLGPGGEWGEQNTLRFLEAIQTVLACYPPFYGCAVISEAPPYDDTVFALKVDEVYPVNYYGPSYIEKFGRERLLSAPTWKAEKIADGILLAPSIKAIYDDDPEVLESVRQHLGK